MKKWIIVLFVLSLFAPLTCLAKGEEAKKEGPGTAFGQVVDEDATGRAEDLEEESAGDKVVREAQATSALTSPHTIQFRTSAPSLPRASCR